MLAPGFWDDQRVARRLAREAEGLREELTLYDASLGERPEIIIVSKCELPEAEDVRTRLAAETGRDVIAASAVTGQGLDRLLAAVAAEMDRRQREQPA